MSKTKIVKLATKHIRTDGGTQPRGELNEAVVSEYSEAMQGGAEFPPCIVFYDGSNNWLADGFHRYFGADQAKMSLLCEQRPGTRRDAILYSVGANATHGLRRTNADKRRAVETMLADEEWGAWSNNKIAEMCRVSNELVVSVRESHYPKTDSDDSNNNQELARTFVTKHGTIAQMNTANIGQVPGRANRIDEGEEDALPDAFDDDTPAPDETEPEATPAHLADLQSRFSNATVVRDNMSTPDVPAPVPVYADSADEEDLTDEEWLITIPLFEYLVANNNPALLLKTDALAWRTMHQSKAFGAFKNAVHKAFNLNSASTPLSQTVSKACYVKHPREWGACVKCRAKGCSECGYAGYALDHGLSVEQLGARP